MKSALFASLLLLILATALPADALIRRSNDNPLFRRTALSGYIGAGFPTGDFASERDGDGNHESGALDWAIELEHFFGPTYSFGFTVGNTTYQDKTLDELETHVSTYAGYMRFMWPNDSSAFPFLRAGVGGMQVQFQDDVSRIESDLATMLQLGGGVVFLLSDMIALNGQLTYTHGFTQDTDIDNQFIVGFDSQYWTVSGGVSVIFP